MEYELFSVGGASPLGNNYGCQNNECIDQNCTDYGCVGGHCHIGGDDGGDDNGNCPDNKTCGLLTTCGGTNPSCSVVNSRCGNEDIINGIGNTTL